MARKINEKDVVVGAAALGLGYLLLTRKAPTPSGGGAGGGAGNAVKEAAEVVVDELGGLGVTTPEYIINLPGVSTDAEDSFTMADFLDLFGGGPVPDPAPEPDTKAFDWPKVSIEDIDIKIPGVVDAINFLAGQKRLPSAPKTDFISNLFRFGKLARKGVDYGSQLTHTTTVREAITLAFPNFGADLPVSTKGTTVVKGKKGRKERVSAFRTKYNIPVDYNYPVTGTPIKVR